MTKKELLEDAQLLEVARKKASRKAMLAESELIRRAWERQALALLHGAEALRREAGALSGWGISCRDYTPALTRTRTSTTTASFASRRNRVEWIHPDGRFAVIRFSYDNGSFCESFSLKGGQLCD